MRRLFIIRKDLHLSGGKLAAMVGHCCEAYWTNLIKKYAKNASDDGLFEDYDGGVRFPLDIDLDIWNEYVNGIFTKTICEAKNLFQLKKVESLIEGLGLVEGRDYGYINDKCLTELAPENEDGTTTVGIWFKPLPDETAHTISKKYKLYKD